MKKIFLGILAATVICGSAAYFYLNQPITLVDTSDWKTYEGVGPRFSFKYPPQYVLTADTRATNTTNESAQDSIYVTDPEDTSRYEFHVIPLHLVVMTQPIVYNGPTYHSVDEYINSKVFRQEGAVNPEGQVVTIGNNKAVLYHFQNTGTAEDAPVDLYVFVHEDLIYEFFFKASDRNKTAMLNSISWR